MLVLGLCFVFGLFDYIVVGVMVLVVCLGGMISNLISYIVKVNLVFLVSLIVIFIIVCVFLMFFII